MTYKSKWNLCRDFTFVRLGAKRSVRATVRQRNYCNCPNGTLAQPEQTIETLK